MPWPHKNSDGVVPSPNDYGPSVLSYKSYSDYAKSLLYGGKLSNNNFIIDEEPVFPPSILPEEYVKNLMGLGIPPKYHAKVIGQFPQENPVLIPASQVNMHYLHSDALYPIAVPYTSPTKAVQFDIRIKGLNVKHDTYGAMIPIDTYHSYTEAEIRTMLMKQFGDFTDKIIQQLKDKK